MDSDDSLSRSYLGLATELAQAGHDVTVVVCGGGVIPRQFWPSGGRPRGVTLTALPSRGRWPEHGSPLVWQAIRFYQWIRRRAYDLVHLPETTGLAYFALIARRQGLCLDRTAFCVGLLRPTLWVLDRTRQLVSDPNDLVADQLERGVVRMADSVWSPTPAMLRWIAGRAWARPRDVVIMPRPARPATPADQRRQQRGATRHAIRQVVFVGDLSETTSRLELFCSALTMLAQTGVGPERVFLCGRLGMVGTTAAEKYIAERATSWPWSWHIQPATTPSAYVSGLTEDTLTVVLPRSDHAPDLLSELSAAGAPFLTLADEVVAHLIHRSDRPQVTVPAHAVDLAARLQLCLRNGAFIGRASFGVREGEERWRQYNRRLLGTTLRRAPSGSRRGSTPLVSVCITSHNRPHLLRHALASIRRQDYPAFEVVLVDDSSDAAALRYLGRLRDEFHRRGWTLVHRDDRFVSAARNHAARLAKGRYLLFMDDDNIAKRREVTTLVAAIRASRADIVTCFLDVFEGGSSRPTPTDRKWVWPFLGGSVGTALFRNVLGDTNCLMRKDTFLSLGGFNEDEGIGFEDWDLLARAVARGLTVEPVPEPLVWFRRSADGMSGRHADRAVHFRVAHAILATADPQLVPVAEIAKSYWLAAKAGGGGTVVAADHVRTVAVFGAGSMGKMALALARRCGWETALVVDNNPQLWNRPVGDFVVRSPESLISQKCDLVIIASVVHAQEIADQLTGYGLVAHRDFMHCYDAVNVGGVRLQLDA